MQLMYIRLPVLPHTYIVPTKNSAAYSSYINESEVFFGVFVSSKDLKCVCLSNSCTKISLGFIDGAWRMPKVNLSNLRLIC